MRFHTTVIALLFASACAARGPSDPEVRATLESSLAQVTQQIGRGDAAGVASRMTPDATLMLRGVAGPDGQLLNQDVEGAAAIRGFMGQVGAPPDFRMTSTGFARAGDTATQTGTWSIAGAQTGTFVLDWVAGDDGTWRIRRWRMEGGA